MSKIRSSHLLLALLLMFTFAVGTTVIADGEISQVKLSRKKRGCDYDKTAATDEERSSGDCSGTVPTPEPVTIFLFSAGLAGVGFAARRRLRRSEGN